MCFSSHAEDEESPVPAQWSACWLGYFLPAPAEVYKTRWGRWAQSWRRSSGPRTQTHQHSFCAYLFTLHAIPATQATNMFQQFYEDKKGHVRNSPRGLVFSKVLFISTWGQTAMGGGVPLRLLKFHTLYSCKPGYVTRPLNFCDAAVVVRVLHWTMRISSAFGNHCSTTMVRTANSYHFPEGETRKQTWREGKNRKECKPTETH